MKRMSIDQNMRWLSNLLSNSLKTRRFMSLIVRQEGMSSMWSQPQPSM